MQESFSLVGYLPAVLTVHAQAPLATPGHRGEHLPPTQQPVPHIPFPRTAVVPTCSVTQGKGLPGSSLHGGFPFAPSEEIPGQRQHLQLQLGTDWAGLAQRVRGTRGDMKGKQHCAWSSCFPTGHPSCCLRLEGITKPPGLAPRLWSTGSVAEGAGILPQCQEGWCAGCETVQERGHLHLPCPQQHAACSAPSPPTHALAHTLH